MHLKDEVEDEYSHIGALQEGRTQWFEVHKMKKEIGSAAQYNCGEL